MTNKPKETSKLAPCAVKDRFKAKFPLFSLSPAICGMQHKVNKICNFLEKRKVERYFPIIYINVRNIEKYNKYTYMKYTLILSILNGNQINLLK